MLLSCLEYYLPLRGMLFKWVCDLNKITLSSNAVYPCWNEGKRVLNCVLSHTISDLSGCCMQEHRQASGQACSCFCRYGCEGRINNVTNLLAAESWLHCLLQAYSFTRFARYVWVCVCVCVCGWLVFFQMSAWSVQLKKNEPTSCTFCVISAMDIDSVHGVPAWSSDMWWTLVAKLM